MKGKRGILIGVVTLLLVAALFGTALATTGSRTATLHYNNIGITLDGEELVPKDANGKTVEPFIIDGTTYLPVRAISEAVGLDVEWDSTTDTVVLTTPGIISSGTVVYEDEYVSIAFEKIQDSKYSFYACDAVFIVTNKTDYELTFQSDAISFNGVSYGVAVSDEVAPNSMGRIYCSCEEEIPRDITVTSGAITVIDWERDGGAFPDYSYEAKWTGK